MIDTLVNIGKDVQQLKSDGVNFKDTEVPSLVNLIDFITGTDAGLTGKARSITGSMFIFGHSTRGRFGSGTNIGEGNIQTYLGGNPENNFGAYTSGTFAPGESQRTVTIQLV